MFVRSFIIFFAVCFRCEVNMSTNKDTTKTSILKELVRQLASLTVWHDPDKSISISEPYQFLEHTGTLDKLHEVYEQYNKKYSALVRIEFRQQQEIERMLNSRTFEVNKISKISQAFGQMASGRENLSSDSMESGGLSFTEYLKMLLLKLGEREDPPRRNTARKYSHSSNYKKDENNTKEDKSNEKFGLNFSSDKLRLIGSSDTSDYSCDSSSQSTSTEDWIKLNEKTRVLHSNLISTEKDLFNIRNDFVEKFNALCVLIKDAVRRLENLPDISHIPTFPPGWGGGPSGGWPPGGWPPGGWPPGGWQPGGWPPGGRPPGGRPPGGRPPGGWPPGGGPPGVEAWPGVQVFEERITYGIAGTTVIAVTQNFTKRNLYLVRNYTWFECKGETLIPTIRYRQPHCHNKTLSGKPYCVFNYAIRKRTDINYLCIFLHSGRVLSNDCPGGGLTTIQRKIEQCGQRTEVDFPDGSVPGYFPDGSVPEPYSPFPIRTTVISVLTEEVAEIIGGVLRII